MRTLREILGSHTTTIVLLALHALAVLSSLWVFQGMSASDQPTYMGLADGLAQGRFTYWIGTFDPPPMETYRTQGYPAFILLARSLAGGVLGIKLVQMAIYLGLLMLVLRALRRHVHGVRAGNLFLLFMLPQFQMLYYTQMVFPELLMAVLCTSAVLAALPAPDRPPRAIIVGVLLAAGFWVRPVLLLFPLFVWLMDQVFLRARVGRRVLRMELLVLLVFSATGPLPFALWNLKTHGVFKPVPISGSGVISNMGIWQMRLPGYGTMHYFRYSFFGRELLPWVGPDAAEGYYTLYQEQWQRIDSLTAPAMTPEDRERIPIMIAEHPRLFVTRSAPYTIALDKAITRENIKMIADDPGYFLLSRLYTAIRLWVTSPSPPMEKIVYRPEGDLRPIARLPHGITAWAKVLAPFLITGLTFGAAFVVLLRRIVRRYGPWLDRRWILYMVLYIWMIHIPMAIQSRYTVPVHVLLIMAVALALADGGASRATRSTDA